MDKSKDKPAKEKAPELKRDPKTKRIQGILTMGDMIGKPDPKKDKKK